MPAKKPTAANTSQRSFVIFTCTLVGFLGGGMITTFNIASSVATKPYVEKGLEDNRKYTDDKAIILRSEAFDHSDANRQAMMLQMEKMNTENKTAQMQVETKVDEVLGTVRQMRDEAWNYASDKRRNKK
jgi:hypothetical protein